MKSSRIAIALLGMVWLWSAGAARAAVIDSVGIVPALDSGWYASRYGSPRAHHWTWNTNYIVGDYRGAEYRNFAVFDLGGIDGRVQEAALLLYNPAFFTGGYRGGRTETYRVFDYGGDIGALVGGTGGRAAFTDLGTGTGYGGTRVSAAANGRWIKVLLNESAVAAINNTRRLFALGGRLTSLAPGGASEYLFGWSGWTAPRLAYRVAVPAPATLGLLVLGLAILGVARRRLARNPLAGF